MELDEGTYTVLVHGAGAAPEEIAMRHGGMLVGERTLAFRGAAQAVHCAVEMQDARATARVVVLASGLRMLARAGEALASALVPELAAGDAELRFGEAREVSLPGL